MSTFKASDVAAEPLREGVCTQEKLSPIARPAEAAAQTALVASIPPLNLEGAEPKLP